mgnify:CR=1 FL=1
MIKITYGYGAHFPNNDANNIIFNNLEEVDGKQRVNLTISNNTDAAFVYFILPQPTAT